MHSRYLVGRSTAAAPGVVWASAYLAKASAFAHGSRSGLLWRTAFDKFPVGVRCGVGGTGLIGAEAHRCICGIYPTGEFAVRMDMKNGPPVRVRSRVSAPVLRAPEGTALLSSQSAHRRRLCGRVRTERHRRKDRTRRGKAGKRPEAFSGGIGQGRRGGIHRIQTLRHGQPASAMLTTQGKMSRFLPVQISAACRRRLCPFILVVRAGTRSGPAAPN